MQEVLVPGGDLDDFPASNRPWKGVQVKHFRIVLLYATSVAARRAFIWGVPVSDVRESFWISTRWMEGSTWRPGGRHGTADHVTGADVGGRVGSTRFAGRAPLGWTLEQVRRHVAACTSVRTPGAPRHEGLLPIGEDVRAAVARHYAQSQADVERAVTDRHQVGEVEAPAVAPSAAPAATPSSSVPAADDDGRSSTPPVKRRSEESRAAPRSATRRRGLVTDTDDEPVTPEQRRILNELFGTSSEESLESPTVTATAPAASTITPLTRLTPTATAPASATVDASDDDFALPPASAPALSSSENTEESVEDSTQPPPSTLTPAPAASALAPSDSAPGHVLCGASGQPSTGASARTDPSTPWLERFPWTTAASAAGSGRQTNPPVDQCPAQPRIAAPICRAWCLSRTSFGEAGAATYAASVTAV
eukprot:4050358-Pleurochrysis_carterae.AAC.2